MNALQIAIIALLYWFAGWAVFLFFVALIGGFIPAWAADDGEDGVKAILFMMFSAPAATLLVALALHLTKTWGTS